MIFKMRTIFFVMVGLIWLALYNRNLNPLAKVELLIWVILTVFSVVGFFVADWMDKDLGKG